MGQTFSFIKDVVVLHCSTAPFGVGIPIVELEVVRVARGKIPIGGVGGKEIFAEEDWIVSLERTDD